MKTMPILSLNVLKIAFCFSLIIIMVGCGNRYTFKGQNFNSQEEALAAQKSDADSVTLQITPTEKPHGGFAVMILPSFDTFVALGIKKTGNPKQDSIDFTAKSLVINFRAMFDYLNKRKIFEKVILVEDDYPIAMTKKMIADHDAVIYFNLVSPDQSQWFMKVTPDYKNTAINFDKSTAAGYPRAMSWLDDIEKNLDSASYKPKR